MSTKIDYTFRINGTKTYDCATYSVTERVLTAMLVSGDVTQVRSDLSSITLIEVLKKDGTVEYSTEVFNKLVGANLRIGFGYNDETKTAFDMIQVSFQKYELEEKMTEIEKKVDSIDAQVNPVVNFNTMPLSEVRKYKISESKDLLKEYLEGHPIASDCHGGVTGTYSITEEKQSLMTSQYTSYKVEQTFNPDAVLKWNETGKTCEVWIEEEFLQLVLEVKYRVEPLVEYQRQYEKTVNECNTKEEVLAVELDYDSVEYVKPSFDVAIVDEPTHDGQADEEINTEEPTVDEVADE